MVIFSIYFPSVAFLLAFDNIFILSRKKQASFDGLDF